MNLRKKRPDKEKALSLVECSESDMNYTLGLEISDSSANTIIRNIYESFRMLGEAVLVVKGFEPSDHIVCISELLKLKVETSRPINLVENLRRLRHNINYYGYRAESKEAEDVISIAKSCFDPLLKAVKEMISGDNK